MRGDLCPFDHGNDPVVLEDVALTQVLNFNHPPTHPLVPPGTGPAAPLNPPTSAQPPPPAELPEGLVERGGATPGIPLEPPPHHLQHPVAHPHLRGPHPGNMGRYLSQKYPIKIDSLMF